MELIVTRTPCEHTRLPWIAMEVQSTRYWVLRTRTDKRSWRTYNMFVRITHLLPGLNTYEIAYVAIGLAAHSISRCR